MRTTLQLLIGALLRRHPDPEILQACADLELKGLANRLVRYHVRTCEACNDEMQGATEVLDLLRGEDVDPFEVTAGRDRLVAAMSSISEDQQHAIRDVCRLLGTHAAEAFSNGRATPELETELAAFLGSRAASSLLRRMAA